MAIMAASSLNPDEMARSMGDRPKARRRERRRSTKRKGRFECEKRGENRQRKGENEVGEFEIQTENG